MPVDLSQIKANFKDFFGRKVTHKTIGEVTLIGYRVESDLNDYPEFYIKDSKNKRYWVMPQEMFFDLK